ncbi:hypothetical protein JCM10908_003852 [Rhodotorula pacifica]|uniref:anaphase promoting complex subunit 2 n=1 Tax=Rhodotorula pacifica TaxID=1495444 RepID=UPI00317492D4
MEADILRVWSSISSSFASSGQQVRTAAESWERVTAAVDPHNDWMAVYGATVSLRSVLAQELASLSSAGVMDQLFAWYLERMQTAFADVREDNETHLDRFEIATDSDRLAVMLSLLDRIGQWISRWQTPVTDIWESSYKLSTFRKAFLAGLYGALPPRFVPAFQIFIRRLLTFDSPAAAFSPEYPRAMGTLITILDRYDPILFALIYEEIEAKVHRDCRGNFGEKKLDSLITWLNGSGGGAGTTGGVMGWVSGLYANGEKRNSSDDAKKFLKPTFSRFEYHIHKILCQLRTTELFDIIIAYPASQPALEDLKVCLQKTDQRSLLVSRLRLQLSERLLHPGVDTKDIITTYISAIRCLRIVDPAGVLLSRVADPIRQYLRSRTDTIRCIVASLIEEGNPLFVELSSSDAKLVSDSRDEAENFNDPKWTPDPVDAPPNYRKSKGADVIQLLVSIYDTKDVFIKELQVLLAQRLLAIRDYALEKETKNLETLKTRFGEQALQGCEVMLKDLQDSKQLDASVHARMPNVPLHATIVSRLFWPSFQPTPLKLPGQLGRAQAAYDRAFASNKNDKRLRWMPQLGNVNLTIELKDRKVTADATPLQAAVIELFDKQDTWTSEALQQELKVTDASTVRNALYFWNNLGVLGSMPDDMWRLLEEQAAPSASVEAAPVHVMEEEKQAVQSVEEKQVEEMRVFWQYIQGMLTNLGALPLSRIHATLNMLAPGYKGKTVDELTALLEKVAAEGLVLKTASGSWKIVK